MQTTTGAMDARQSPSQFYEQYKGYLLEGETIESVFDLGVRFLRMYMVIATNRRLIIIKKFPKNLLEIDYANIELIEYYTNVDWRYSLYAGLLLIVTALFFFNRVAVIEQLSSLFSPAAPILEAPLLSWLNAGGFLVTLIGLGAFAYFFGLFVVSLMGRLRILVYNQPPIDIVSDLTTDIQNVIKIFETKKRTAASAPRQMPSPPSPLTSPPKI